MASAGRMAQIEEVIRDWLDEPGLTLFCGDWQNGSVMEILPEGRVTLTAPKYPEPFSGLRDILLTGQGHHIHLDLAKLQTAVYAVTPCVCYGYRPSFEVQFRDTNGGSTAFSLGVREPYAGRHINRAALVGYFRRLIDHHARFPDVVRFCLEPAARTSAAAADGWSDVLDCFREASELSTERCFALAGAEVLGLGVPAVLGGAHHA